ncbi:hypothetical protein [Sinomicrobium sp. M5D2P17]
MEKIVIRNKPKCEIVLLKDSFEVLDSLDRENSGVYFYDKTKHFSLTTTRINWLVSIFSFIVNLLTGSVAGGIFREKNQLKFKYNHVEKQIILDESNLKKAKMVQNKISSRLS